MRMGRVYEKQSNKSISIHSISSSCEMWNVLSILKITKEFPKKGSWLANSQWLKKSSTYARLGCSFEVFRLVWARTNTMMNSEGVWSSDNQKPTPDDWRWKLASVCICCLFVSACTTTTKRIGSLWWKEIKHELSALNESCVVCLQTTSTSPLK